MVTDIKNIYLALFLVFMGLVGCTPVSRGIKSTQVGTAQNKHVSHKPLLEEERQRLAHVAHNFVGRSKLKVGQKEFRRDCSGAIRAIFAAARLRLGGILKNNDDNDVKTIYRYVQKYGHIIKNNPLPGDLVFFHNTYDRSRNGLLNDALTHIGIVEKIEGDIVYFVHHLGQIIIRSRMNLKLPKQSFDPKTNTRINHVLRRAQGRHRAYTAGELFAAFGRL
jgi:peptidoglycan DL-endopeptidase CwlO